MARVGREREGDDVTERHSRGRHKGKSQKGKEGGGARPQKSGRQNGRPEKKKASDFKHVLFSSARRTGGGGGRKYNKRAPFLPFLQQRNNLAYTPILPPPPWSSASLQSSPPPPPFASIPRGTVSHLPPPPLCLSLFCMSFLFL